MFYPERHFMYTGVMFFHFILINMFWLFVVRLAILYNTVQDIYLVLYIYLYFYSLECVDQCVLRSDILGGTISSVFAKHARR